MGNWCRKFGIYACLLLPAGFIAVESVNAALSTEEKERVERLAREKPSIDLELLFGYRSARIERENMAAFEELGRALSSPDLKGTTVLIAGHTASEGDEAYEQELSQRRAEAVKRFLVENFDISPENLVAVGYGSAQLKNSNDPRAPENRRVQIVNMDSSRYRGRGVR